MLMTSQYSDFPELTGLKGGQKHMWLQQHKETILDFHKEFGDTATRRTFQLGENTLHNILQSNESTSNHKSFTKADRALAQAEITRAGLQEIKHEVKSLRQDFERFQQSVGEQLVSKFFLPLLQAGLKIDSDLNLPEEDKLRIDDLDLQKLSEQTQEKLNK